MIVFNIKNIQEDYAKCLSIIDYIKGKVNHFTFDSPISMSVYYNSKHYSNTFKSVKDSIIYKIEKDIDKLSPKMIFENQDVDLSLNIKPYYNGYYFRVINNDESDCVNFSHYELLAEHLDNCYLGIIPLNNSDIYRISSFYSVLNLQASDDFYNTRFFINTNHDNKGKIIQRFNLKGIYTARTYFPLLKTNLETYRALNRSTNNFFITNGVSEKMYRNYTEKCVEEFCKKLYNELTQKIKSLTEQLKEKLGNTSYLALAYFLSFLYYTERYEVSKSNLVSILVDAEDFAEGTLQLIENAYQHASNGYFCYRIHKKETKKKYFDEYYYGEPNVNDDKCNEYLEILISDYNIENDIPSKFIYNLNATHNTSREIKNRFNDIELKDFFDYYGCKHDAWKEYYNIPENISLHYGLLSFEQIVNRTNGYLSLVSTVKHFSDKKSVYYKSTYSLFEKNSYNYRAHIPGTQYRILFPIKYDDKNMPTGLNANLALHDDTISEIIIINIKALDILNRVRNTLQQNNNNQKNDYIHLYVEEMLYEIESKYQKTPNANYDHIILCIDSERILQSNEAEVLSKSIIWLVNKEDFRINKIGLINVSHTLFSVFIRMFGVLYYKVERCNSMSNKEVFLCDKDCQTEIEFYGEDISNALSVSHYLSNSKGEYPLELTILEQIATKCEINTIENHERLEVFPFDVVLPKDNHTLFERKVYSDLNRDIQDYPFGCKLNNVHMQVGSKIHIKDAFYEATLLFEISNYVTRFAYILAKKIHNELLNQSKINNHTVLVGYETYSEMLIVHTIRVLEDVFRCKNISYVIYEEQSSDDHFRHWKKTNKESNYIIIVPIGSTLTTHNKIEADILRKNEKASFLMNLCVILIRNFEDSQNNNVNSNKPRKIENIFWKSIDISSKIVEMADQYQLKANNEVHYISCVENTWTTQKECDLCFPKDNDLVSERPILKVNKASVVPMTMIGLSVDKTLVLPSAIRDLYTENENHKKTKISSNTFRMLKQALMYGHYKRGDNHFEYYIKTDKLFEAIKKYDCDKFDEWIDLSLKNNKSVEKESVIKYDFLVAPLHKTNAAFVEYINEKAFGTAKMILWIDVKREYRDNIKTKYSNLTQLYYNLIEANKNAEINFHYIDDTITTGYSFERIKNLLVSLFPSKAIKEKINIKVNIFASVILLLNRCSNNTKTKYIEDINKYHSYVDLNISVMRHHKDACSQCKKHDDYRNLISLSSSNYLAEQFNHRKNDSKISIISHQEESTKCTEKEYFKLYFTHVINTEMSLLEHKKNNEDEVFKLIVKVIKKVCNSSSKNKCKKITTLLEVISSPFIEYRYSVQLATFDVLLRLTQAFIFNTEDDKLGDLPDSIIKNVSSEEKSEILRTLFEQMSKMGANYILRNSIIFGFLKYINKNKLEYSKEDWIKFYVKIIKQSLYFNKQGSRSIYFEHTILNQLKYSKVDNNMKNSLDKLLMFAYLENNIIIDDVLNEMVTAINRDELMAHNMKPISENSTILDAIKATKYLSNNNSTNECVVKTLMQYFCSDYLDFNSIKAGDINTDSIITKVLSSLSIAKLLLIPNGDLTGLQDNKSYYYTLLNHLSNVLEISKENIQGVQLYIVTENTYKANSNIQTVFISSSNNNIKEESPDFSDFIKASFGKTNFINVGDTYYFTDELKNETSCRFNLIKIANNANNISKSKVYWCFVYTSDIEENYISLKRVRNFLVLREALKMRLKNDFDNNLFDEYYQLKNKVSKLSNQKAGSHTPFEELRIAFSKIRDEIESKSIDLDDNQTCMITECLKMISDSLISKWYVYNITDGFPDTMPKHSKHQVDFLSSYEKLFKICDKLKINEQEGTIVPRIKWNLEFDNSVLLRFPNKSSFIWCCAFYSSIINAIRHGYQRDQTSANEFEVFISVYLKKSSNKNYICISNKYYSIENTSTQENGITLTALKYYFDSYYGKDEFKFERKQGDFIVSIPCECDKEN